MPSNVEQFKKSISGKPYMMVAGRILLAHGDNEKLDILTDVVYEDEFVVRMKATVTTDKGTFTGHAESYKQTGSTFERKSPLEVAETSAIGRALGAASYALEDGMASADEVENAEGRPDSRPTRQQNPPIPIRQRDQGSGVGTMPPMTQNAPRNKAEEEKALAQELRRQAWSLMSKMGIEREDTKEYIQKWAGKSPDDMVANDWADLVSDLQSKIR